MVDSRAYDRDCLFGLAVIVTEDVEARRHEAATAALTCQWGELSFVRTYVRQSQTRGCHDIGTS
jgi:hypothetical protein